MSFVVIDQSKPLAPPPSGFPSMAQMSRPGVPGGPPGGGQPGGGPPVNMFSRKAGEFRVFKCHRHKEASVTGFPPTMMRLILKRPEEQVRGCPEPRWYH